MRWDKNNVREGMFVTSTKGERIGKVIRCASETFVVEKGAFFPKDYELRYDHITEINNGGISYSLVDFFHREERLQQASSTAAATAATSTPDLNAARLAAAKATAGAKPETAKEVRIPLMQEELEVEKYQRESGHVKIHKEVRTEERHFTVPVRREEVVIEHVTSFAGGVGTGGPAEFKEVTVDIPLYEEEIRISKHPVLREEMVIRTVAHAVDREGTATLRHEEVEVEDTRRLSAPASSSSSSSSASGGLRSSPSSSSPSGGLRSPGSR